MEPLIVDFDEVEAVTYAPAEWRDLPLGLKVKLRPLTGLVSTAVDAQISQEISAFRRGGDVLERYGFGPEEFGLMADEQIAMGFASYLQACVRGQLLIEEWNLVAPGGVPIPINGATVQRLFRVGIIPGTGALIMSAFQTLCEAPARRLVSEKNGSTPSPNGAGAGEQPSAPDAGSSTIPAPRAGAAKARAGSSARKPSTSRKPPKG